MCVKECACVRQSAEAALVPTAQRVEAGMGLGAGKRNAWAGKGSGWAGKGRGWDGASKAESGEGNGIEKKKR